MLWYRIYDIAYRKNSNDIYERVSRVYFRIQ